MASFRWPVARPVMWGILVSACAESVVPPGPAPHLVLTGGNEQIATALDTLPLPLEIEVLDDEGKPVVGRQVTWTATEGGGSLVPVDDATDARGYARAVWILGFAAGTQAASAVVSGEDDPARFTATAMAPAGFKAIALMRGLSGSHMCALDADSLAWCWGRNDSGQLGDGTTNASDVPRKVSGDMRFASIYGTWGNTCGLTAAGALWCWGANRGPFALGIFGNGTDAPSAIPVPAASGLTFTDFDMDGTVACGVTPEGRGYCWGDGREGLGNGGMVSASSVPVEIAGDRRWREIAVGDDRRCAVAEDWKVYCWAQPYIARWEWIGVEESAGPDDTPLPVGFISGITAVTSSWYNQCGISLAGGATAVCWGAAYVGAYPFTAPGPVWLRLPATIRTVVTEGPTGVALDGNGALWIWGQPPGCCDGFISSEPVALQPAASWRAVSLANGLHAIAARDSTVYAFSRWPFPYDGSPLALAPVPLP